MPFVIRVQKGMVDEAGLEPATFWEQILSLPRMPVPPLIQRAFFFCARARNEFIMKTRRNNNETGGMRSR